LVGGEGLVGDNTNPRGRETGKREKRTVAPNRRHNSGAEDEKRRANTGGA